MSDSKSGLEKLLVSYATLDFRADKWGMERIVYDAIQNHFPEDAHGTKYWIVFTQGDKYVDFRDYDPTQPVSEIFFCDDGVGYGYIYTVLRHSSKKERETQTGKFGEGLKMISAAALRHGVDITFSSQNWSARPRVGKIHLQRENKDLELLCQRVTFCETEIEGSYTLFRNPSPELVTQVLSFSQKNIDFRSDLELTEIKGTHPKHRVFLPPKEFQGELFVRRIKYPTERPLYLTYQINGEIADSLLTPDRDQVNKYSLDNAISQVLVNLNQIDLIKGLINVKTPGCVEKSIIFADGAQVRYPALWQQAFYELYGHKTLLEEPEKVNVNLNVKNRGYNVVAGIPIGMKTILHGSGVKKASEVLNYRPSYEFLPVEALTEEQREIYQKHIAVNELLFGNQFAADLHLFSRAYDANGDVNWFLGICDFSGEKPQIYIRASVLQKPREHIKKETLDHLEAMIASDSIKDPERFLKEVAFLSTYVHEAMHAQKKAVDGEAVFEEGLTDAAGIALAVYFRKQQ